MAILNPSIRPALPGSLLAVVLALALAACAAPAAMPPQAAPPQAAVPACPTGTVPMQRFELYLGGSTGEEEWQAFIDAEVTPRFPRGFTFADARGQFQLTSGAIDKEDSRILIVVVPDTLTASAYIGAIGQAYSERFAQEAVLLVRAGVCAGLIGPGPE